MSITLFWILGSRHKMLKERFLNDEECTSWLFFGIFYLCSLSLLSFQTTGIVSTGLLEDKVLSVLLRNLRTSTTLHSLPWSHSKQTVLDPRSAPGGSRTVSLLRGLQGETRTEKTNESKVPTKISSYHICKMNKIFPVSF